MLLNSKSNRMKALKIIGMTLALGVSVVANAQSEIRKEVNVDVINGEHLLTISTTDKDGKVTKEEYKGEEAKKKMHEMRENVPEGAQIEREVVEEFTDEEGNTMVIRKSHSGEKGDMKWMPKEQMTQEEREVFHKKMEAFHKDLTPKERELLHHHMMRKQRDMSPEERDKMREKMAQMHDEMDVEVDEEKGIITIKMGDEVEVIDMNELKESGDGQHKMIFITEDEKDNGEGTKVHKKIIVISKNVRIEEDEDLQNDLRGVDFKTFPNPNDGNFNIELKLDGKKTTFFSITDLSGKEYHKGEIKVQEKGIYTQPVRMEDMPKGTYLIQVSQGKKAATKKVVVE